MSTAVAPIPRAALHPGRPCPTRRGRSRSPSRGCGLTRPVGCTPTRRMAGEWWPWELPRGAVQPTSHSVALATVIHSGGRELACSALYTPQPQKKKRPGCSLPAGSFLFGAYRIIRRTPHQHGDASAAHLACDKPVTRTGRLDPASGTVRGRGRWERPAAEHPRRATRASNAGNALGPADGVPKFARLALPWSGDTTTRAGTGSAGRRRT